MQFGSIVSALGIAAVLAWPSSAAARETDLARWQQVVAAFRANDCPKAIRSGAPLLDADDDGTVPPKVRAAGYTVVAACELRTGRTDRAYRHALAGSALPDAPDALWQIRLALELDGNDAAAAVATIEAMNRGRGAALNAMPVRSVYTLAARLKAQGDDALRGRFFAVVTDSTYAPDDPFGSKDGLRRQAALYYAAAGDGARASTLLGEIEDARTLLAVRLDRRTRALLAPAPDLRAAMEAELVRDRERMRQHPERLAGPIEVAGDLRALGRPQEALVVLESVRDRIATPSAFEDAGEWLNWWWDSVARVYAMLGRTDEALAAFDTGSGLEEGGRRNVSQAINLASNQVTLGRPADALRTLAPFGSAKMPISPFGEIEMRLARGCAFHRTGVADKARADLDYVRRHASDNPHGLSQLLLCIGDDESAAQAVIARLDTPDQSAEALEELADFDAPPVRLPPDPIVDGMARIKTRADVQAAIARAGGTLRVPLQHSEF